MSGLYHVLTPLTYSNFDMRPRESQEATRPPRKLLWQGDGLINQLLAHQSGDPLARGCHLLDGEKDALVGRLDLIRAYLNLDRLRFSSQQDLDVQFLCSGIEFEPRDLAVIGHDRFIEHGWSGTGDEMILCLAKNAHVPLLIGDVLSVKEQSS